MVSEDHALILYDNERGIATFHPGAWDIVVKADALGSMMPLWTLADDQS